MTDASTPSHAAADACLQSGLQASQADRVEEALAYFREAAMLAPQSGVPHFLIGAELAQLGRLDEAEAAYADAVLLAPELHMARYQLGLLQFTSGRPGVALVTWSPLFQLPADHVLQRVVHGFAALAQDDFGPAAQCFREAMALNRDNPALNRDLQLLLDRVGALTASAVGAPVPDVADEPVASSTEETGVHVLLSNYRQHGSLH